jgi:PKD domain
MTPPTRTRAAFGAAIVIALLLMVAPAANAKRFSGLVPDIPTGGHVRSTPTARIANLPYGGGPVMNTNRTHVIFWQPTGSGLAYDPGYATQVETFLRRVAHDSHKTTNVYSLSGQYHDSKGPAAYDSTFAGGVLDTSRLPFSGCVEPIGPPPLGSGPGWTVCLTDAQLVTELRRVTQADHLPVTSRDIYFLVLPSGFGVCENGGPPGCALGGGDDTGSFCGYHSSDPEGALLYAVIPYNALSGHCQSGSPRPNGSTADPTLSTISHEHNEAVTDPTGTAWIDSDFNENGDLCINMTDNVPPTLGGSGASAYSQVIDGGHYWLQEEWSNADRGCQPWAKADSASFQPPKRIRTGQAITFTARARVGHDRVKAYVWFFGNRGQGRGRVVKHTFTRAGSYRLVLRVTDSWDNWAYAVHPVTVTAAKRATRKPGRRR